MSQWGTTGSGEKRGRNPFNQGRKGEKGDATLKGGERGRNPYKGEKGDATLIIPSHLSAVARVVDIVRGVRSCVLACE